MVFCLGCEEKLRSFKTFKQTCKASWATLACKYSTEWACELELLLSDSPIPSKFASGNNGYLDGDIYIVDSDSEASTLPLHDTEMIDCGIDWDEDEADSNAKNNQIEEKLSEKFEITGDLEAPVPVNEVIIDPDPNLNEKQGTSQLSSPSKELVGNHTNSTTNSNQDKSSIEKSQTIVQSNRCLLPVARNGKGGCFICHKISSNLQNHYIKEHTSPTHDRRFICTSCTRIFDDTKKMILHLKKYHSNYLEPKACSSCSETFTDSGTYRKHLTKHQRPSQKHVCNICGKVETKASRLHSHIMRIHNGALHCKYCYKPFADRVDLDVHLDMERAKLKDKPDFICDICGFRAKWRKQLDRHLERKHIKSSPKDLPCFQCNKVFSNKDNLAHHVKYAHERRYECSECSQTFGYPVSNLLSISNVYFNL